MAKKMLIDATHAEETRVVVADGNKVEEFDFESENKRQLAGNIYLAKVTRVEPSLQAAFVDYGGNRHGFLAFSEIHPDYYQIPVADREALMEEERAYAEAQRALDEEEETSKKRGRGRRGRTRAQSLKSKDAVEVKDVEDAQLTGMETIDLDTEGHDLSEPADEVGAVEEIAQPETAETSVPEDVPQAADPDSAEADHAESGADQDAEQEVQETASEDAEPEAEQTSSDGTGEASADDEAGSDDEASSAADKDESIEAIADDDDTFDLRQIRKPRPRRYKIQEVVKVRQIMLIQVVKEERGNKGAALTTYLSLAGRYCVLMPNTARGGGISRKITNASDRKKLKEIAHEIDVPQGAGLIIRTAGAKRTKTEIKRDYEYLQRLWEQIRELTLKSTAPAKIYEEGDLIKRSIRDLYNREIDEVLVEGERGYRIAKDFMKMIMPSHAKNVKNYHDSLPLFARYQVESYLSSMFNPVVQLKSGGYLVIGVTEALVAIDVNSGRATKEGSIEETALKTNLEAAEEVARQLRLRDLAGLIVIDFIDMEERRNNNSVEKRIKDKLKTDRARIQVGRISGFGLMEMSRQRLRPGMIEATTQPCPHCHGTGLIRSDDNLALSILRQIEEEGVRRRTREVLVKCPVPIANYLMNQKREHVAQIESRYGLSVRIEGVASLVSPDYEIEKFKTATRVVPEPTETVVSVDAVDMEQFDDSEDSSETPEAKDDTQEEGNKPRKRRRRRRRRKSGQAQEDGAVNNDGEASSDSKDDQSGAQDVQDEPAQQEQTVDVVDTAVAAADEPAAEQAAPSEEKPAKRTRKPRAKKKVEDTPDEGVEAVAEPAMSAETAVVEEVKPKRKRAPRKTKAQKEAEAAAAATEDGAGGSSADAEQTTESPAAPSQAANMQAPAEMADAPVEPSKSKKRGWWSIGK
ncbi:MAG: Rne/Rng family ribonuclease [Marinovum sp.]|nr:Rne/Rng family ribonuclease [Marinovum sp.]MBT7908760.1 Rne/Rng family ribonuclease [Marinovum sp.]